jgi:hypothetical protein
MNYPYNIDYTPTFETDEEYQRDVHKLFRMNCELNEDYDETAANNAMDFIYSRTKDMPHFQEIYKLAAATMLSEDLEIGLAVLCSYDYLIDFHTCLVSHIKLQDGMDFTSFEKIKLRLAS